MPKTFYYQEGKALVFPSFVVLLSFVFSLNRPDSFCKALICLLMALIPAASVRAVSFCSKAAI